MKWQGDISLKYSSLDTEAESQSKALRPSAPNQKRELRLSILAVGTRQQVFAVDSACGAWLVASGDLAQCFRRQTRTKR
jgi:hypothetical protein